MKKKSLILIIATLVVIAAAAYIWVRLNNRWTDIYSEGTLIFALMSFKGSGKNLPESFYFA